MTHALEVHDLRKVYRTATAAGHDEFVAVDCATFHLAESGSLALVGESGSGKTTIARILAGLDAPTSGTVLVAGAPRPPAPWPRRDRLCLARQVQMVFQDPNSSLDPGQTIADSLTEVLRLHSDRDTAWRRHRVGELLLQVGLDDRHRDLRPRSLSGGERQRVAIARALAVEPQVLILDEAVSALDVSVQAHVLNLLADLRAELGLTYLFISHDLGVVRHISDECVVMKRGVMMESGRTTDVLDHPQSEYTRELLAAVPRPGWRPRRSATT